MLLLNGFTYGWYSWHLSMPHIKTIISRHSHLDLKVYLKKQLGSCVNYDNMVRFSW